MIEWWCWKVFKSVVKFHNFFGAFPAQNMFLSRTCCIRNPFFMSSGASCLWDKNVLSWLPVDMLTMSACYNCQTAQWKSHTHTHTWGMETFILKIQNFSMTLSKFRNHRTFPVFHFKFKDLPMFPWPAQTLLYERNIASMQLNSAQHTVKSADLCVWQTWHGEEFCSQINQPTSLSNTLQVERNSAAR